MSESRLLDAELQEWKEYHAPHRNINHTQSNKAMKERAAAVMRSLSLERRYFRYEDMLADAEHYFWYVDTLEDDDSTAFNTVCNTAPYDDREVRKLECVNHALMCMWTVLRKLAKAKRSG